MIGDILSPTHLLFILVVALIFLGPKRLPEAGRALGRGIRDFRMAIGGEDQSHGAIPTDAMTAPPPSFATTPVATPPAATAPVSPAPEAAEPPPAPAPASGPPPPATEAAEPARPFV